jgi:hypothetical protein
MKLQFSLATLLVCMTVLAVACAVAVSVPVYEKSFVRISGSYPNFGGGSATAFETVDTDRHPPTAKPVVRRLSWSAPLALTVTLGVLWIIRRLKSRRHTGPPVG